MSAATAPRRTSFRSNGKQPILGYVQKAGTVIYKGCAVGHVAGVFQPCDTGVNGLVFAGYAAETFDAAAEGSNYTWPSPMVFHRDCRPFAGKGGDLPTAADLGQTVYFDDDQTVKHTQATHDVGANLVEIEGSLYWVEA